MRVLVKYAAAGVVAITAFPAGCVPVVTANWLAGLVRIDDWQPNAPLTAWAIAIIVGIIVPLVLSVVAVLIFFRFLGYVRRLEPEAELLMLGRTAWQVLLYAGVLLGVATGIGFQLAIDGR